MKFSLFLTAGILGTTALAAWFQHRAAATGLAGRDQLRAEVVRLGIDPDWLTAQANPGILTPWKSSQVIAKADAAAALAAREANVRTIARAIIAFAKDQKELEKSGQQMDQETKKRAMDVFEKLMDLKEADFAILLEEVRSDSSLPKEAQAELIGMSVMMLAQQNPRSALKLVLESKDLLKENPGMSFMAGMAIGRLAETDPAAAFAWMEEHKDSGFVNDMARQQALAGLAKADPERALRNILDQKEEDPGKSGQFSSSRFAGSIAQGANRDTLLAAVRKVTADPPAPGAEKKVTELRDAVLAGIGSQLVRGGFDTAALWLESTTLSPEEKSQVLNGVTGGLYGTDPTPWLGWMQKNLPAAQFDTQTGAIIRQWTQRDYNAVGTWLNTQPVGPAKDAATISFAETLIPHEPEAARRWIDTLPAGEKKNDLLKQLPKDSAAKPEE
jgi:hypothetical protein